MAQAKNNRELANLGADQASTDVNEGYTTCSKAKINSMVQDTEENNVLRPQKAAHNDSNNALVDAAVILSLLSPPTDNSNSQHINQGHMIYYDHTCYHFLDYFNDPFLDDTVIYTGDLPVHYSKIKGRYTKLIGKPIDSVF